MRKPHFAFVLPISIILCAIEGRAQIDHQPAEHSCSIPLSNPYKVSIAFAYAHDGKTWIDSKVGPNETYCFSLVDSVDVKVITTQGNNTVKEYKYTLERGARYEFYWYSTETAWFIVHITHR